MSCIFNLLLIAPVNCDRMVRCAKLLIPLFNSDKYQLSVNCFYPTSDFRFSMSANGQSLQLHSCILSLACL